MNKVENPFQGSPLSEKEEKEKAENFLLTKNLVQFLFANLDYHNRHPDEENAPESEQEKIVEGYGQEFEQWYESEAGITALTHYIETHDREAILQEKDMSDLIQSFLIFRNRSSQ